MHISMNTLSLPMGILTISFAGYFLSKKISKINADIENLYTRLEFIEEYLAKKEVGSIESKYDSDCETESD